MNNVICYKDKIGGQRVGKTLVCRLLWLSFALAFLFQGIPVYGQFALPQAHFTNPQVLLSEKRDKSVFKHIEAVLNAVPAGETIHVCMFKFSSDRMAKLLNQTQKRGVEVHLIVDKGDKSDQANDDVERICRGEIEGFWAFNNEISKNSIIHAKFILLSALHTENGLVRNVVLQTSSNLQKKDTEKFQDLLVFTDPVIYQAYFDFWQEIVDLGKNETLESFESFSKYNSITQLKAQFFPRGRESRNSYFDNVTEVLFRLNSPESTTLRFAVGKWDSSADEVVKALNDLALRGARIICLVDEGHENEVREALAAIPNLELHPLPEGSPQLHTKFWLIETREKTGTDRWLITGSQNFTKKSFWYNFEVVLYWKNPPVYSDYLNYFEQLCEKFPVASPAVLQD